MVSDLGTVVAAVVISCCFYRRLTCVSLSIPVAGDWTDDHRGRVYAVGGLEEKIAIAKQAGMTTMAYPWQSGLPTNSHGLEPILVDSVLECYGPPSKV